MTAQQWFEGANDKVSLLSLKLFPGFSPLCLCAELLEKGNAFN